MGNADCVKTMVNIYLLLVKVKVTWSGWTLRDPMDYTVHGILQAIILEWVAFPFASPRIKPRSPALQADSLLTEPQGSPRILEWVAYPLSSGSSPSRNWTGVSCVASRFFTNWAMKEVQGLYQVNTDKTPWLCGMSDGMPVYWVWAQRREALQICVDFHVFWFTDCFESILWCQTIWMFYEMMCAIQTKDNTTVDCFWRNELR